MPGLRLLRALQRCMSGSGLFPARHDAYAGRAFRATGLQAQASRHPSCLPGTPSSDGLAYRSIIPCLPTLICSSFATSRLGRCFLQRPFLCAAISELKLLVSYVVVGKAHLPALRVRTYSFLGRPGWVITQIAVNDRMY
jgi:hypothetical protein